MKTDNLPSAHVGTYSLDQIIIQVCKITTNMQNTASNQIHPLGYLAWLFFLKFLEYQEQQALPVKRKEDAPFVLFKTTPYTWSIWTANTLEAETQEQVTDFLYKELFPLLQKNFDIDTSCIYIYSDLAVFKQVLTLVNSVNLEQNSKKDDIIYLYSKLLDTFTKEDKAKSEKLTGIFSTPLPLVRFMVKLTNPQQGEIIYDPACGTGNLFVEAYKHIHDLDPKRPITNTFQGIEAHPNVLQLCKMNLLLHNIDCSQLQERDLTSPTISMFDLFTYPDPHRENYQKTKNKKQVILTHPPFNTLDSKTKIKDASRGNATFQDYDRHFLEHCMNQLVDSEDQCVIIVSQNILLNRSNIDIELRKNLVKNFNIRMIVRLPPETFEPFTSYPTYLLFFQKGENSSKILCYRMPQYEKISKKKRQIGDKDFDQLLTVWQKWAQSPSEDILRGEQGMYIQIKDCNELHKPDSKYILTIDTPQQDENPARDLEKMFDQLLQNTIDLHNLTQKLRNEITGKEDIHDTGE